MKIKAEDLRTECSDMADRLREIVVMNGIIETNPELHDAAEKILGWLYDEAWIEPKGGWKTEGKENLSTQVKEQIQSKYESHKDMFLKEAGKEVESKQFEESGHYEEFKKEAKDILSKAIDNKEITEEDATSVRAEFKLESKAEYVKRIDMNTKEDVIKVLRDLFDTDLMAFVDGRDLDNASAEQFVKSSLFKDFKESLIMVMRKGFHNNIIKAEDFDEILNTFKIETSESDLNLILAKAPKPDSPPATGMKWAYDATDDTWVLVAES